jgi:hypothetical protein
MATSEVVESLVRAEDLTTDPLSHERARLAERDAELAADEQRTQEALATARRDFAKGTGEIGAVTTAQARLAAIADARATIGGEMAAVQAALVTRRAQAERERAFQESIYHANRAAELYEALDAARRAAAETIARVIGHVVDLRIAVETGQFAFLTTAAPLQPQGFGTVDEDERFCRELEERGADLNGVAKNLLDSAADCAPWIPLFPGLTFVNRVRDATVRFTGVEHGELVDALVAAERQKRARAAQRGSPTNG